MQQSSGRSRTTCRAACFSSENPRVFSQCSREHLRLVAVAVVLRLHEQAAGEHQLLAAAVLGEVGLLSPLAPLLLELLFGLRGSPPRPLPSPGLVLLLPLLARGCRGCWCRWCSTWPAFFCVLSFLLLLTFAGCVCLRALTRFPFCFLPGCLCGVVDVRSRFELKGMDARPHLHFARGGH